MGAWLLHTRCSVLAPAYEGTTATPSNEAAPALLPAARTCAAGREPPDLDLKDARGRTPPDVATGPAIAALFADVITVELTDDVDTEWEVIDIVKADSVPQGHAPTCACIRCRMDRDTQGEPAEGAVHSCFSPRHL